MAKFAVEGSSFVVRFSLPEVVTTHRKILRIPVSQVESVSAEPHPREWLSQYLKLGRGSPFPEEMAAIVPGKGLKPPEVIVQRRWTNYVGDDIIKVVGPPGAQVYVRFNPRLPALRVNLTEAAPYIGFMVAHPSPEAAAADLQAAVLGQVR